MNQNPTNADMIRSSADMMQNRGSHEFGGTETCQSPRDIQKAIKKKTHPMMQKFEMKCFTSPRRKQSNEDDD